MSNSFNHHPRRVERLSIETPLLVPSFSSRGFPEVGGIIDALSVDVGSLCLVSAFDLSKGHIHADFETLADIVIIDSGMYEASPSAVAVDAYLPAASNREWTREAYRAFLASSSSRMSVTNTIIVSFDSYTTLDEQIEQARVDFSSAPDAAKDFLMKPELAGQVHESWALDSLRVGDFDIIGVTERELGRSAVERCRALLKLRASLTTMGLTIPIHVFGSITPAAVTAYFLCGADIFDGLNWLRVGFDEAAASAPSEFAITHRLWADEDASILLEFWRRNLRMLQRTQGALRRFAADADLGALCETLPFAQTCLALADMAACTEEK